jgi:hypothetical protein
MFANAAGADIMISKYFLFFLLSILIYSILASADFPENDFLKWLLGIPIAFLAVAFITPDDLIGILTTYGALGMTLSVILPFMILFFFNTMLLTGKKLTVGKILLQRFLWLLFSIFLIYRMIMLFVEGRTTSGIVVVIIISAVVISALITIFNSRYTRMVSKLRNIARIETSKRNQLETQLAAQEVRSEKVIQEADEAVRPDAWKDLGSNIGFSKNY